MKILLVEDTRSMAAIMMARLRDFGYEVSLAENGQVAVEMFIQSPPDLVLMDIEMPVMNGMQATSLIRAHEASQQWAWTPILFLTASDTVENLVTAIDAGGDDFMSKMVPEAVLQAKMKAMTRIATLRRQLLAANSKLQDLASRDGLTGLFNRRAMDTRTDAAWLEATQGGQPFGLLMLDVDNFKKYNDHYGHQNGDDCLRAVAQAMEAVVSADDSACQQSGAFVARYGGEEFAVVLPKVDRASLDRTSTRILDAVRGRALPHENNADWGIVTVSIGGVWIETARDRIVTLFRAADANLYKAKDAGRNRAELSSIA